MPVIFALIAAIAFASGYGISYKIDRAEIIGLELAIQHQKDEAQALLSGAKFRVSEAEKQAIEANNQLDQDHAQHIQDIATLHDKLSNLRLRDPGRRSSCPKPLPEGSSTSQLINPTDPAEISKELSGFLLDQFESADKVAEYAQQCFKFVQSNCGIVEGL